MVFVMVVVMAVTIVTSVLLILFVLCDSLLGNRMIMCDLSCFLMRSCESCIKQCLLVRSRFLGGGEGPPEFFNLLLQLHDLARRGLCSFTSTTFVSIAPGKCVISFFLCSLDLVGRTQIDGDVIDHVNMRVSISNRRRVCNSNMKYSNNDTSRALVGLMITSDQARVLEEEIFMHTPAAQHRIRPFEFRALQLLGAASFGFPALMLSWAQQSLLVRRVTAAYESYEPMSGAFRDCSHVEVSPLPAAPKTEHTPALGLESVSPTEGGQQEHTRVLVTQMHHHQLHKRCRSGTSVARKVAALIFSSSSLQ